VARDRSSKRDVTLHELCSLAPFRLQPSLTSRPGRGNTRSPAPRLFREGCRGLPKRGRLLKEDPFEYPSTRTIYVGRSPTVYAKTADRRTALLSTSNIPDQSHPHVMLIALMHRRPVSASANLNQQVSNFRGLAPVCSQFPQPLPMQRLSLKFGRSQMGHGRLPLGTPYDLLYSARAILRDSLARLRRPVGTSGRIATRRAGSR
jgi:hypothetical protein